jgi:hypothetical protein
VVIWTTPLTLRPWVQAGCELVAVALVACAPSSGVVRWNLISLRQIQTVRAPLQRRCQHTAESHSCGRGDDGGDAQSLDLGALPTTSPRSVCVPDSSTRTPQM